MSIKQASKQASKQKALCIDFRIAASSSKEKDRNTKEESRGRKTQRACKQGEKRATEVWRSEAEADDRRC
jgi:hypothetical protein